MSEFKIQFIDFGYAFRIAWKNSQSYIVRYLIFSVVSLLAAFLFDVYFLAYIMSMLLGGEDWNRVLIVCMVGAVLVVVRIFCGKYAEVMQMAYSTTNIEKVKYQLYEKSLEFDLTEYYTPQYYDQYSFVLSHGSENINKSVSIMVNIISALCYCIFFIAEFFRQNRMVIIAMSLMLGFHMTVTYFKNRTLTDIQYKNDKQLQPLVRKQDYFARLFYLKAYANELKDEALYHYILEQYEQSSEVYERAYIAGKRKEMFWNLFSNIYDNLFLYLIVPILFVNILKLEGIYDISIYWKTSALFVKLTGLYFLNFHNDIMSLSKYVRQLRNFLNKERKHEDKIFKMESAPAVQIKKLFFKYDSNSDFSLKNINISIQPGERVAIVGRNGSGKTTLLNLLLGLYMPETGEILVDGKNMSEYSQIGNRKVCGLLCQNFNLYSTTLKENITMGDDIYCEEDIMNAATLAQCDAFLNDIPLGLNSTIGRDIDNKAIELSRGQAQRIALARIFLSNAYLCLLDEPTAAIDNIVEKKIVNNLWIQMQGKTTIVITHRLDITRLVDRIIVMDNGTIVESGSFDDLMSRKSIFHDMYQYQMGGE